MKITVVGSIFGASGYANHTRSLANALADIGCDVAIDSQPVQGWERMVDDRELSMLTKKHKEDSTMIMIAQPQFWRLGLAENPKHFIGFLVWEGDKIPRYWLQYLLDPRVEQVWVPSVHVYNAIISSFDNAASLIDDAEREGVVEDWSKLRIVPHGVDPSKFNTSTRIPRIV